VKTSNTSADAPSCPPVFSEVGAVRIRDLEYLDVGAVRQRERLGSRGPEDNERVVVGEVNSARVGGSVTRDIDLEAALHHGHSMLRRRAVACCFSPGAGDRMATPKDGTREAFRHRTATGVT
jgi:hypothetical protein